MAVRVIESKPNPNVVKRKVCRNCGVTLEYLPLDVKQGSDTDYTGSTDVYWYIDCPSCNKEVTVRG